ncbi:MAG: exonuclease domain-containing protein [Acetatifactor sp.]|nr:exonuclease domain-containing protein [Acetatifactor sp.]
MNYIVFDLEWNQGNGDPETSVASLPFEVVEIGAVKLNDDCIMVNEFSQLVKPQVYHEMNQITGRLIHLQMQELERGKPFVETAEAFLDWCGPEEYLFCTWGSLDLTELQRNMQYHKMTQLSKGPIAFLDVQKLFSLAYEDGRSRRSLEYAVDELGIEKDIPFHRAFGDAYYTARVLNCVYRKNCSVLQKLSYDLYHPPVRREDEIKVQFDTYAKYISRLFRTKAEALADREVSSSKCYLCHRNLRKKLKWFTPNGRHYYCLAFCEKHGFLKGKIRIRRSENGMIYVVKTTKLIGREEAEGLVQRRNQAAEAHHRRS